MRTFVRLIFVVGMFGIGAGQCASRQPFSISVRATKTEVKAGSPVELSILMTNTSAGAIDASSSYDAGLDISYEYHVQRPDGTILQPRQQDGPISGTSKVRTLAPGKSVEDATSLSSEYDMSQPGRYIIQLSRPVSNNPKDGVVKSNKVTVTVTP